MPPDLLEDGCCCCLGVVRWGLEDDPARSHDGDDDDDKGTGSEALTFSPLLSCASETDPTKGGGEAASLPLPTPFPPSSSFLLDSTAGNCRRHRLRERPDGGGDLSGVPFDWAPWC